MRVMVMVKANEDSEAGVMPSTELLTAMGKYNEELVKAGVMLAGEGAASQLEGQARALLRRRPVGDRRAVRRDQGADRRLLDPPGQVDMDEAIEWVKRCPNPMEGESEIEIRQVFEAEDFGDQLTPELREQEERLREQAGAQG